MSNYTKSTNFAVKDGLSAGTAAKRVRGTEIDDEYNAIAVAVATKANINNTALTGVPTAPTASASTNSTQLATTAYTTTAVAAIPTVTAAVINGHAYPVGSIYTSVVATNPNTLLSVGVWSAIGQGRVLLGAGGGYTAGDTGGATTDSHELQIGEIPAHTHSITQRGIQGSTYSFAEALTNQGGGISMTLNTAPTGGGGVHTHDIMQPYIVVYIWKRTS